MNTDPKKCVPEGYELLSTEVNLDKALQYKGDKKYIIVSLLRPEIQIDNNKLDLKHFHLINSPWVICKEKEYEIKSRLSFINAILLSAKTNSKMKHYDDYTFMTLSEIEGEFDQALYDQKHCEDQNCYLEKYSGCGWEVKVFKQ